MEPYRNHRYIRFHALQGLFLFAVYLVARLVFAPIPVSIFPFHHTLGVFALRQLVQLAIVIAQIWGMVETARGRDYRLPVLSELAEKSM